MTWTKLGSEFFDECAAEGLSDTAVRTHAEAISWIYGVENTDLCFQRHLIRRFAGSPQWEAAVTELVRLGWWVTHEDTYVLVHHADVIRASITAQQIKRDRDKRAQRSYRKRSEVRDVSADVSASVSGDADSQTDSLDRRSTDEEKQAAGITTGRPHPDRCSTSVSADARCEECGSGGLLRLDEFGVPVCVGRCVQVGS
jgi:hypothetical protein